MRKIFSARISLTALSFEEADTEDLPQQGGLFRKKKYSERKFIKYILKKDPTGNQSWAHATIIAKI